MTPRTQSARGAACPGTVDQEFYRNLLDEIADGGYFMERNRRISYWNAGAERITGCAAAEVVGHSCSEGILRHVNEAGKQLCLVGCPLTAVMLDGQKREAPGYRHHQDGHQVPVVNMAGRHRLPVPETTPPAIARMLVGAYQHPDGLLLVISLNQVLPSRSQQLR